MKKILFVLVSALLLCQQTRCLALDFPFTAETISDEVNVRAGANDSFESLCKLKNGEKAVVVAEEYDWYKIQLPKRAACYINSEYLSKDDQTKIGQVKANRVNLRARPNTVSNVLAQLNKGDKVKITGKIDGWIKIQPPDTCYGWAAKKYLKFYSQSIETPKPEGQTTQDAQTQAAAPPQPQYAFNSDGIIKPVLCVFNCIGTHKLINDKGETVCVLIGDKAALKKLINSKVNIQGDILQYPDEPYPVIKPQKIQAIQ